MNIFKRWYEVQRRLAFALLMGILILPVWGIEWSLQRLHLELDIPWSGFRVFVICVAAAGYGLHRVLGNHPFCRPGYRQWLAQTPWSAEQPLPFGTILLAWEDVVVLAALGGLTFFDVTSWADRGVVALVIAILFLGCYLAMLWRTTYRERVAFFVCLFLAPLVVYPWFNPLATLAVFGVVYVVLVVGTRRLLSRFPWDELDWAIHPEQRYLNTAFATGVIGWPYSVLNWNPNIVRVSLKMALLFSSLLAWWTHAALGIWIHFIGVDEREGREAIANLLADSKIGAQDSLPWWTMFYLALALLRFWIYRRGHQPPLGLFGRLVTGRWIIPKYDYYLLGPWAIILFGYFGPTVLNKLGFPLPLLPAACVFIVVLIAFSMPPRLEHWQLTGSHRITDLTVARMRAQQQRASQPIQIKLFG